VVSGHLPPGHADSLVAWESLAGLRGTLVLMMAVQNAPAIAATLLAHGRDPGTAVAVVCDGSMPTERTVLSTLGALADDLVRHAVTAPAIIVIGEVVGVAFPDASPEPTEPGG
jgi:uroporphyrin-III C-methyltransferase / precorrin-2 dehydrogenase / sirohydrochlorin ferrochelatase